MIKVCTQKMPRLGLIHVSWCMHGLSHQRILLQLHEQINITKGFSMGERRKRKSMWDKEDDTKPFSVMGEHNSGDHPGHSSLESFEENPVAPMNDSFNKNRQNAPERKDIEGMESHKYNHTRDSDRSHSRRYLERGRSRSRSRSRTRGRSRSRSRSDGDERGQSYGWNDDRKRIPDKSSQICRDFASGKCRRGNQCRFFHPKNEDDKEESWRGHGPYHEEDEQYPNKNRNSGPSKDFVKGKCRWGDTCRFSHHFASDENRGNRYASSDKDNENQSYRNGKSFCKYFAAGKCERDNCRFSHEDPKQRRRVEEESLDVKRSWRSENIDTIVENIDQRAKTEGDCRWGHSLANKKESWDLSERKGSSGKWDKRSSPPERSGNYGNDESIDKEKGGNKQEHPVRNGLQLQNQDGNLKDVLENNNRASSLQTGQNLNQNGENLFHGHSSASTETNNGFSNDFNGPEAHLSGQIMGLTETVVPENLPNLLTEHLAQLTNSAVAIAGQLSHDPVNPLQNGTVANEHGNRMEQDESNRANGEGNKGDGNNKQSETVPASGKVEESSANKDTRIFKNSLIEFVKEILKPTWKEGRMSREDHKTIVKKVVDKITSTIQADHVPKTQDKVEQYLSVSKPKIAKLVQAYVGRCLKTDS